MPSIRALVFLNQPSTWARAGLYSLNQLPFGNLLEQNHHVNLIAFNFQGKDRCNPCVPSCEPFPFSSVCFRCRVPLWRSNHGNPSARMEATCAVLPSIPKIPTVFFSAPAPAIFISQLTRALHGRALPAPGTQQRWFWITSLLIPRIPGIFLPLHGMHSYPIAMVIF